jgi:hypothetical protein
MGGEPVLDCVFNTPFVDVHNRDERAAGLPCHGCNKKADGARTDDERR